LSDHFVDVNNNGRPWVECATQRRGVALTRYACYLIAQNGDSRRKRSHSAQTYFALQTRKQELIEQRLDEIERLKARKGLAASEKELSGLIFERLKNHESFARIRSKGDAALFGGHTTLDMKRRLGVRMRGRWRTSCRRSRSKRKTLRTR